jgi:glycosyltransferase involved in cell wall biosynthesis
VRIAYFHYLSRTDSALTHVGEFARAARDLGADLDVYAMNAQAEPGSAGDVAPALGRASRSLKRHLSRYLHEPKELFWNWRYLRQEGRIVRAYHPEVLLVRARLLTASFMLTARRFGLPLVLEVNAPVLESSVYKPEYFHLPYLPTALERWQLEAADAITVVSSALKSYFVDRHRVAPAKITVVPNGADVTRFRPDVAPESLPWPAEGGAPVVGFIGSFQEFHGVGILGRLITRVAEQRPGVRFLLVGDGERAETLRAAVSHLGNRVFFAGRVAHDRIPALVTAFDVGLLPETAFYCSPLKLVEWMAAGRAIVAPRYEPVTDLITDGVEGVLFPPRDEEALFAAVLSLVDDAARRIRLGEAARKRAVDSFTWRSNAGEVLATCHAVAARSSKSE